MSSRKEDERNEKIIRGLLKLPPNRNCINCNSLGPQYVCINFWTFVCITCSGIHREFTHRVKSVSLAKFTFQEVEALQKGGNQRARDFFLKDWDLQRMILPDSSNAEKIREFIKHVYVDKKFAVSKSSDLQSGDTKNLKSHEDHRRSRSYHSHSQSPIYDHQYEETRQGKKPGVLTRKPGSDRGQYEGKISSFLHSPDQLPKQMHEERFSDESSILKTSDKIGIVVSPFKFGEHSPNFQDERCNSPPSQKVRDILDQDAKSQPSNTQYKANVRQDLNGIPHPLRTASCSSIGSFASESISLRSVNSGNLADALAESEHPSRAQSTEISVASSLIRSSSATNTPNQDLFGILVTETPSICSAPSVDLFAEITPQSSFANSSSQNFLEDPFSENGQWATFDLPHHTEHATVINNQLPFMANPVGDASKGHKDAFTSLPSHDIHPFISAPWHLSSNEASQPWHAFTDGTENSSHSLFESPTQNLHSQDLVHNPYVGIKMKEDPVKNAYGRSVVQERWHDLSAASNGAVVTSLPPSILPPMVNTAWERKSTNPFDLPYSLEHESDNEFLDMNSLQAALPNSHLSIGHPSGFPEPWLSPSSTTPFISPGLTYIAGQLPGPQLLNIHSRAPVASVGGNPFA
ncbi:hypothetical protein J5N97_014582 [Dioscorea zingiberensis]|uniref:Arf-GAP domain-containing protein n=1 Tax=Dioscorea zingiberensis TaxID=325984 RepID=A0A9D5CTQ8_9LILI|nr:hypothetical protein J5N97_014582 [Dioscorea zingiberensis]